MTTPFEDAVARKVYDLGERDCQCENCTIDRAVRVTIEELAQEAEGLTVHWDQSVTNTTIDVGDGADSVADWLRSHLPDGDK